MWLASVSLVLNMIGLFQPISGKDFEPEKPAFTARK
jgi:hypothetical protein